jgi:hypothetical protein
MSCRFFRCVLIALALLAPVTGAAQTAPGESSSAPLEIRRKEVLAVQAELSDRGYYQARLHGILDQETRVALRRYQSDHGLAADGRIDRATLASLELAYPVIEVKDRRRRNGLLPRIGYAVKDGTVATGKAVGGTVKAVGEHGKSGAEKAVEATTGAAAKTGEVAQSAGEGTADAATTVGRGTARTARRAREVLVGRSDEEINRDVRAILQNDPRTVMVRSEIKSGAVTLITEQEQDLSAAVEKIRKIEGVRSAVVVYQ